MQLEFLINFYLREKSLFKEMCVLAQNDVLSDENKNITCNTLELLIALPLFDTLYLFSDNRTHIYTIIMYYFLSLFF